MLAFNWCSATIAEICTDHIRDSLLSTRAINMSVFLLKLTTLLS